MVLDANARGGTTTPALNALASILVATTLIGVGVAYLLGAPALESQRMNARDWLAAFAEQLGTDPPTAEEFKTILDIAAEAAHASERVAAPAACWVAARAGVSLGEALEAARELGGAVPESRG